MLDSISNRNRHPSACYVYNYTNRGTSKYLNDYDHGDHTQ
jgi:hypothetical protein